MLEVKKCGESYRDLYCMPFLAILISQLGRHLETNQTFYCWSSPLRLVSWLILYPVLKFIVIVLQA